MPFKIVIVGTGIAGLGAAIALVDKGHDITVVEATSKLQAIGGIIVTQANANRVLDYMGVYKPLLKICSVDPFPSGERRYADGTWLAHRDGTEHPERWGYPFWSVHHADYQQVLYEAAKERGVKLRLGCPVVSVDENTPAVIVKGGERVEGDLIIGADGVKSIVRRSIFPDEVGAVRDSGLDVTRANIPEAIMRSNPETSGFMDHVSLWFGPSAIIAQCPIRRGDEWLGGFGFTHQRGENSADDVSRPQNIEKLKGYFKDFAPEIQKVLSYVKEAHVWRMMETMPASWVSKSGKVVLAGDAAHAVLPYVGQGGGMGLEDAVTLAECLERAKTTDEIPKVMKAYQEIREPRCKLVQEWSSAKAKNFTLPDGPEQEERDKILKAHNTFREQKPWDKVHIDDVPESISSKDWQAWLLGHDAVGYARRQLDHKFGRGL